MPASLLQRVVPQELSYEEKRILQEQLEKELDDCSEVQDSYKNKVQKFMLIHDIWSITDINYQTRVDYQEFLKTEVSRSSVNIYLKGFDRIKQHSIRKQMQTLEGRRNLQLKFENQILFLPYHPEQKLAMQFDNSTKKESLVWDFQLDAPEVMKRQIFDVLHYIIGQYENGKSRRRNLVALRKFYDFCVKEQIEDIEYLEMEQIQRYKESLSTQRELEANLRIVDIGRKAIFVESAEINWNANVWYMERFHFEKTRINPSRPVESISFLEVAQKKNRKILQQYMKYCLGITHLSINNLRSEFIVVRRFLIWMDKNDLPSVCDVTNNDMERYFTSLDEKEIQADTYNKEIICILHFYDYLRTREFIKEIPFCEQYYLKKTVQRHHDRSLTEQAFTDILQKLHYFPEELRLMFLHLWGIGLRASEVCTLKGNAYYVQGRDTWIQIYQIKMKNYKRIPIPAAIYKLMKAYLKKYQIKPEDYIFKNRKGGAYCYGTFRKRMLEQCAQNGIRQGDYLFQSHAYRHTIATVFYDSGVSIQGVRDYLGHEYEEMTRQYIDYMPKKISKANEEYFCKTENSLSADLKRCKRGK